MAATAVEKRLLVAGEWIETGDWIEVRSPYSGDTVGRVAKAGAEETRRAIDAAAAAMEDPLPAHKRAEILVRVAMALGRRHDEVARQISDEAGKPLKAARVEAKRAMSTYTFAAVEARKLAGEMVPMDAAQAGEGKLGFTLRRPIGVVGAISPFNFPLNLVAHKLALRDFVAILIEHLAHRREQRLDLGALGVERDAVAQADEQHHTYVAHLARRPILADDDALDDLVELFDLAVNLGRADAHTGGIERGIRASVDNHAVVRGELDPVAVAPDAGKALEVRGAILRFPVIVPEPERHRRKRLLASHGRSHAGGAVAGRPGIAEGEGSGPAGGAQDEDPPRVHRAATSRARSAIAGPEAYASRQP